MKLQLLWNPCCKQTQHCRWRAESSQAFQQWPKRKNKTKARQELLLGFIYLLHACVATGQLLAEVSDVVVILLQVLLEVVAPERQQGFLHLRVELRREQRSLATACAAFRVVYLDLWKCSPHRWECEHEKEAAEFENMFSLWQLCAVALLKDSRQEPTASVGSQPGTGGWLMWLSTSQLCRVELPFPDPDTHLFQKTTTR